MIQHFFNGEAVPEGSVQTGPGCANPHAIGGSLPQPRSTTVFPIEGNTYSVIVNKQTHRIKFQDETESQVVVVIEPKE